MDKTDFYKAIYTVVSQIPEGRVCSYGMVARLAGFSGYARHVGAALARLPVGTDVPWHRVINAKGEVSQRSPWADNAGSEIAQRLILEEEGISFDGHGRVYGKTVFWPDESVG